jgi:hypothetical protein
MNKKFWIKLYLEILDDPKMGRLPDHLWRFAVELFLLAGRQGNDGSLPTITEMAWTLRMPEEKVIEDIRSLAEVGIVTARATDAGCTGEVKDGEWCVTHFQERQKCESFERVKRYRERYRNEISNGEVAEVSSTSTSPSKYISNSISQEEEGVQGEGKPISEQDHSEKSQRETAGPKKRVVVPRALPSSPAEAMLHPDVRVFAAATGGRIPGLSQYKSVIDAVRFLRRRERLDDQAIVAYLTPYWLAWSNRKRINGQPYDPGNITWLVEWAINGTIPPNHPPGNSGGLNPETITQDNDEIIRRVARGEL